jgi:DNA-binding transcriptional MocR family regulator
VSQPEIYADVLQPFAQITVSQYVKGGPQLSQLTVVRKVYPKSAKEHGMALVPRAPFYAADADTATLRLSFATADVGRFWRGGRLGRALNSSLSI